jgi:hypothetical protein
MLAEVGRRADFALTRATDVVHEAAHATVLHLRGIVGAFVWLGSDEASC